MCTCNDSRLCELRREEAKSAFVCGSLSSHSSLFHSLSFSPSVETPRESSPCLLPESQSSMSELLASPMRTGLRLRLTCNTYKGGFIHEEETTPLVLVFIQRIRSSFSGCVELSGRTKAGCRRTTSSNFAKNARGKIRGKSQLYHCVSYQNSSLYFNFVLPNLFQIIRNFLLLHKRIYRHV